MPPPVRLLAVSVGTQGFVNQEPCPAGPRRQRGAECRIPGKHDRHPSRLDAPADRPRDMVHQERTASGCRPKLYVLAFRDGMPLHDDMALLVLRLVLVHAQGWTRDLAQPPGS